jgi:hypothetical protein
MSDSTTTIPQDSPKFPISARDLSEKQKSAIELLLLGNSHSATADAINVDRKTLYNWRQDPAFIEALEARRAELWGQAAQRLRAMVHPSLDILQQDLSNRHERARFRAATAVLRLADLRRTLHPTGARKG